MDDAFDANAILIYDEEHQIRLAHSAPEARAQVLARWISKRVLAHASALGQQALKQALRSARFIRPHIFCNFGKIRFSEPR